MFREFKDFRVPLVITALMLMIFSHWIWRVWQGGEQHMLDKESHHAAEFSEMMVSGFRLLHQNNYWHRNEIEKEVAEVLHASPYRFLILMQNDTTLLRIGEVPENAGPPFREGGHLVDNVFVYGHKFRLPKTETKKTFWSRWFGNGLDDSIMPAGDQLLILGRNVRQDNGYIGAVKHFFIPFITVFLLLVVSSTAWIMTIRTRLLSEQLTSERSRSAHLEDLGLAAAGLAHETKNPLGIISGIAQQVAGDPQLSEKNRGMIETIIDEVDKSASRLGNFMTFARKRELVPVSFDIRDLIENIFGIMGPEFETAGVGLKIDCPSQMIIADEDMLRHILVNLLLNSAQASSPGSVITIRMKYHGGRGALVVEDTGGGIPGDLLPDIFKPYVTGRPEGHGLGLAIVKRFSEDHGWTVEAESRRNHGTRITIAGIALSGKSGGSI